MGVSNDRIQFLKWTFDIERENVITKLAQVKKNRKKQLGSFYIENHLKEFHAMSQNISSFIWTRHI
jgi:predicted PolB exonuclease-like 3'-5' exonuclease